jgi:predicted amidophosphoribosyltransferase
VGESNRFTPGVLLGALVDLVLPVVCGGCGRPGVQWCTRCAAAVADVPRAVTPRVDAGVPVWAQGPYRDPLRGAIVGVKEHGRRD